VTLSLLRWNSKPTMTRLSHLPPVTPHVPNHGGHRALWRGPLFGRLSKAGQECLIRHGGFTFLEEEAPQDESSGRNARLHFVWPNKSGPQFDLTDSEAAHVRPYPKATTDILDDKLCLAQLLEGHDDIAPLSIQDPTVLQDIHDENQQDTLYFVKHRFGAQGKSVYVYNPQQLLQWWETACPSNRQDFVLQQEVRPALDEEGRKFVLRAHVLILQRNDNDDCERMPPAQAFLHQDIVSLSHAVPYPTKDEQQQQQQQQPNNKAAYISQAGKKHPLPRLLSDLPPCHPAACSQAQIQTCLEKLMALAITSTTVDLYPSNPFQQPMAAATTCFQLLGVDLLVASKDNEATDDDENAVPTIKICEVNSHPALGWGTMSQVPSKVFRGLMEDTLSILFGIRRDDDDNQFIPLNIH